MAGPALDISNVNGHVDLAPYRARGFRVVGVKLSEGFTFVDPDFAANVAQATKLGMVVLPYHFARPESDKTGAGGVKEARFAVATLRRQEGLTRRLIGRLVLDYETVVDPAFASGFVNQAHTLLGSRPIVYCSASRVAELAKVLGPTQLYWIADYGVAKLPDLGVKVVMWQYTDKLDAKYDGDKVLVPVAELLHRPVPKPWYLIVRSKGRVVARVRYGHGRVKAEMGRLVRLVRHGKVSITRQRGK